MSDMNSKKKMYLVDASNMFYRAFFAIPPLSNAQGLPTNALYGFLSMTMKLLRDVKPDYLVYCFDQKEPSFREGLYPQYKANRDEMPDDLKPQIPYLKKLTSLMGLAQVEMPGFEADDLIGTLALRGLNEGLEVVIVSGDKDFAQLVRPGITLYDTMKDLRTDQSGVQTKFGVRPDQMIDYLALVGDSSDNVPGVRGIGPKGAQKLLGDYQTLQGVYDHVSEIKGATQTKLIENKEMAFLSQKLVTIVTDVPWKGELDQLRVQIVEPQPLNDIFQELGFQKLAVKFFNEATSTAPPPSLVVAAPAKSRTKKTSVSKELVEVEWSVTELQNNIEPYSEIWAVVHSRGLYFAHGQKVLHVAASDSELGQALARKHLRWKGFDLKSIFKALKIEHPIPVWDAQLAAYVVRAKDIGSFEETFLEHCGKSLPDLCSPLELVQAHFELEANLRSKLDELDTEKVFEKLDLPMIPVIAAMEMKGMALDVGELKRQSSLLSTDLARLEKSIHEEAKETFNIGSPKQLANILFEKLKLPPSKKTKTGFSTDSDVLEGLVAAHPIAGLILEYRELSKLKSTYVDALPTLVNPTDHRLHTSLNQTSTTTGRLSSTHPNLQNIPIRTERGREVRKAFVAEPGNVLISADYSQIELRILAHITGDPGLCEAFAQDLDIHAATAASVFGIDVKSVNAEQRRVAKAVNFGIAYGQGAFGLAETLGISRGEAIEIIKKYFERFRGVKKYMEDTVREGAEKGFVSTLFGRRRYIDELRSSNPMLKRAGERAAINAPIQGTASDLMKMAMTEVYRSLPASLLMQIHDELIFECREGDATFLVPEIKSRMESVYQMKVPLKVNIGVGPNWDATK